MSAGVGSGPYPSSYSKFPRGSAEEMSELGKMGSINCLVPEDTDDALLVSRFSPMMSFSCSVVVFNRPLWSHKSCMSTAPPTSHIMIVGYLESTTNRQATNKPEKLEATLLTRMRVSRVTRPKMWARWTYSWTSTEMPRRAKSYVSDLGCQREDSYSRGSLGF